MPRRLPQPWKSREGVPAVPNDPSANEATSGEECFEFWRDMMGRSRAADITSDHVDTFTAQTRHHELGPVTLLWTSFPSIHVRRTGRTTGHADEESYHLTLLTHGHGLVRGHRPGPETVLKTGDLHFVNSTLPYDTRFFDAPGTGAQRPRVEGLGVDLPVSLLPIPADRLRGLIGRRLSGQEGSGALLSQFLIGLDRQGSDLRPAEASRLGTVVVDLMSAWLARELECEHTLTLEARHRTLVGSIRAFVRSNLQDPGLAPPAIAAAHHVSLSHLHRLFTEHSQGETLTAFIRRQRLTKAFHDLADPTLHALPIQAIAARCGIPRAPEFSRAFKAAHGLSPREHRNRTLPS